MKNRPVIDLLSIFALYVIYWTLIYLATEYNLPDALGVTPVSNVTGQQFRDDFNYWSQIIMGVSLFAVLAWYVLGEWGPRAQRTSSGTWLLIWFCLLAFVLAASFAAVWMGPQASENGYALALYFFAGGIIFYWLATMCFSPIGIKTVAPGARIVRRW